MAQTVRSIDDKQPIACITDTIGTQHDDRGVLIIPLDHAEIGVFVASEDIPALIADLQWFLETTRQTRRTVVA